VSAPHYSSRILRYEACLYSFFAREGNNDKDFSFPELSFPDFCDIHLCSISPCGLHNVVLLVES
jgi:hypothetical protein